MDCAALLKRIQAAEQRVKAASTETDKIRAKDELDSCYMLMGVNGLSRAVLEKIAKENGR